MEQIVAVKIAEQIEAQEGLVQIIWHGGEPLACGITHFKKLLEPFELQRIAGKIIHSIQTNGTLINDDWALLLKERGIEVGVSLDGPKWANTKRVNWSNKESHTQTLRGIAVLKKNAVPFTAICVVGEDRLSKAKELYSYFCEMGCYEVGFNIEETSGIHMTEDLDNEVTVKKFWSELFSAWKKNPVVSIREFSNVLTWMNSEPATCTNSPQLEDCFPSITHDGNVVLLSPEFLDAESSHYENFLAGNVLNKTLSDIAIDGEILEYVRNFRKGVEACSQSCEYFEFCKGGQASNKFFELGTTNGTETVFCKNTVKRLVDSVLSVI